MAEDTCRNGLHPISDRYVSPSGKSQCRSCKREVNKRYHRTPKGRVAQARANQVYEATLPGYLRTREFRLRKQREEILTELARLAEEAAACQM